MPRKPRTPSSPESTTPAVAETEDESQAIAQFLDFYRAVKRAGNTAPYGQFLNCADAAAREKGDELIRQSLERITQEAIDDLQKKRDANLFDVPKENETPRLP